ncbi:MAG: hypothetical protein OEU76_06560 [Cyclobacteriaceae bacterium]|nr:hypothetical protein [Cyclobacteriaceae bacterium]
MTHRVAANPNTGFGKDVLHLCGTRLESVGCGLQTGQLRQFRFVPGGLG